MRQRPLGSLMSRYRRLSPQLVALSQRCPVAAVSLTTRDPGSYSRPTVSTFTGENAWRLRHEVFPASVISTAGFDRRSFLSGRLALLGATVLPARERPASPPARPAWARAIWTSF